ncbi:SPASM domain-containing protein [bacterium]|nr:SPASM domain-containing protein [bacterium]MBU1884124.1 SPASM domain-containing protein [bacterium]
MNFHRVHVEITNICGLSCSFCPPKTQPSKTMPITLFEKILTELKPYTKTLALHVMGDPLTLSNLGTYLELAHRHGFEVELTSSGYYLNKTPFSTLFHPSIRQINISLNSYNKNSLNMSFDEYMQGVLNVCEEKLKNHSKPFINLRVWNLDDGCSEVAFNEKLFKLLEQFFDVELQSDEVNQNSKKSIRLDSKILLNFDSYFEWPSLGSTHHSHSACYGLKSHFGILANGTVVPCCLDGDGIIDLGNVNERGLQEILNSKRSLAMIAGFKEAKAVEELCEKCSYKDRFQSVL